MRAYENAGGASNPSRTAAARLRALGLALCKPAPGGKSPSHRGWPTYSLEPQDFGPLDPIGIITGPLSNYGRPGHCLVVPDLDAPAALAKAGRFLPRTGMVDGRPGKPASHPCYLVPLATVPREAWSISTLAAPAAVKACGFPGPKTRHFQDADTDENLIDFLATGAMVVCPPSLHPSGERREWVGGEPGVPAVVSYPDLWGAVCRLAEACGWRPKPARPAPASDDPVHPVDLAPDVVLARARLYLARCPGAVSGKGGHNRTFSVAVALAQGFNLGADVAYQLLRDLYNPRCEPAWSAAELWHKAADADAVTGRQARGWLLVDRPGKRFHGGTVSADGRASVRVIPTRRRGHYILRSQLEID
jgi:hypothetical protein